MRAPFSLRSSYRGLYQQMSKPFPKEKGESRHRGGRKHGLPQVSSSEVGMNPDHPAVTNAPLRKPFPARRGAPVAQGSATREPALGQALRRSSLRPSPGISGCTDRPLWSKSAFLRAALAPDLGTAVLNPQQHPLRPIPRGWRGRGKSCERSRSAELSLG